MTTHAEVTQPAAGEPFIQEQDIESKVCQLCAACCRIRLKIANTDSRYRIFLRTVGFSVLPEPPAGKKDCCENVHDVELDMGNCKHLGVYVDGETKRYSCSLYGSDHFPDLCRHFNCVSWAKTQNCYSVSNGLLMAAQQALKVATRQ